MVNEYIPAQPDVFLDVRRSLNSELDLKPNGHGQLNFEASRQLNTLVRGHPGIQTKFMTPVPPATHPTKSSSLTSTQRILMWTAVLAILAVLGYLTYQHGGKLLATWYEKFLSVFEYLATFREPWRTLILTITSYLIQILGIPIFCVVCMIVSFCYGSYLIGFAVCMTVCVLSNITLYFAMMKAHETIFESDQEDQQLLAQNKKLQFHEFIGFIMKEYIEEFPLQFGFIFRSMHLPDYAKMFIITKYKATLPQMLIPCLCVDSLNVFLYSFIGSQVQHKFDFFSSKAFHEKTTAEQVVSVISLILLVFQIVLLVSGYIYTSRKYAIYQADKAENSTNFHSDGNDDVVQPTGSILVPAPSKCIPQGTANLSLS